MSTPTSALPASSPIEMVWARSSQNRPALRPNPTHADYMSDLLLAEESSDLLVSLYAGPVSRHCTRYLRVGGTLLANPSHGDVAFASLDDRYVLIGAVRARSGTYRVSTDRLSSYLVPKRDEPVTVEAIERTGRGVPYTTSAFAYLFQRVA
jgi:hypothetical protein